MAVVRIAFPWYSRLCLGCEGDRIPILDMSCGMLTLLYVQETLVHTHAFCFPLHLRQILSAYTLEKPDGATEMLDQLQLAIARG
jgi:hypothetical protein